MMSELIAALIGSALTLIGGFSVWVLQERAQTRRIHAVKLEELIKAIHRTNLQVLRLGGKYESRQAEQEMENSVNEIETIVTLYFPEFRPLSARVYKAFVQSLSGDKHEKIAGELRGLEQDLITVWEKWPGAEHIFSPNRRLPRL